MSLWQDMLTPGQILCMNGRPAALDWLIMLALDARKLHVLGLSCALIEVLDAHADSRRCFWHAQS